MSEEDELIKKAALVPLLYSITGPEFRRALEKVMSINPKPTDQPTDPQQEEKVACDIDNQRERLYAACISSDSWAPTIRGLIKQRQQLRARHEALTAALQEVEPKVAWGWARFNETTGSLTWNHRPAAEHPDRCVCQRTDPTPHKHYSDGNHGCARCACNGYQAALTKTGA